MADYPMQEHRNGNNQRSTVAKRDIVTIRIDEAAGGAGQPAYTAELVTNLPAEVLQVAGGEYVRGRQVEAITTFVISTDYIPDLNANARCEVEILSGVYEGTRVYLHRVHYETARSRRRAMQLHCKSRD